MKFTHLLALLTLSVFLVSAKSVFSAPVAVCPVHIDQVEWLFKANNKNFGPANVRILHDLTADFLSERGYHAGSDEISIEPQPAYTHRLEVAYTHGREQIDLRLVRIEGDAGGKPAEKIDTVTLATRQRREKQSDLIDRAEEAYFLAIKKLSVCE